PVELVADVVVGGAVLIVHGIAGIADGLALVAGRTHQFVGAVGDRLGGDGQEGGCFAAVLLAVGLGLAAVVKTFRGNAGGIGGEVIAIPDPPLGQAHTFLREERGAHVVGGLDHARV